MSASSWDRGPDGGRALAQLAPTVGPAIDRVLAALAGRPDRERVDAVAEACAAVHGLTPLRRSGPVAPSAPGGTVVPELLSFAQQFATDVAATAGPQRDAFLAVAGHEAFDLVQVVWAADQLPRLGVALGALFGGAPPAFVLDDPGDAADLWPALEDLARVIARLDALDPVLNELVRLRGARQHDCRLCRSRRSRAAIAAGADDDTFAAVDRYWASDLAEDQQAALALVDDMIWRPARLDPEVVTKVRAHLTPTQAVEVVLDVVRNAQNKIAVALGADDPVVTHGVELYDLTPDGDVVTT